MVGSSKIIYIIFLLQLKVKKKNTNMCMVNAFSDRSPYKYFPRLTKTTTKIRP
jgi:hypothetical protein